MTENNLDLIDCISDRGVLENNVIVRVDEVDDLLLAESAGSDCLLYRCSLGFTGKFLFSIELHLEGFVRFLAKSCGGGCLLSLRLGLLEQAAGHLDVSGDLLLHGLRFEEGLDVKARRLEQWLRLDNIVEGQLLVDRLLPCCGSLRGLLSEDRWDFEVLGI